MKRIAVCQPSVDKKELRNVEDCLKTNWISSKGKYISKFEEAFAEFCGVKYAVTSNSGTAALHLALSSLGISKGDEVIVPVFTMAATVFAVLYTQAKPVFVDVEPDTFNIDPARIEEKITRRTKAVLAVHLYGHPCEMGRILDIARRHKLFLVEDAAEAHGAEFKGRRAGAFGDISAFSFYANKIITTGEGGMIVTNNKQLARRAAILKDMAFDPKKRFLHRQIGFNYRMTNIQAAIGLAQLGKADDFINKRRQNAFFYNQFLKGISGLRLPVEKDYAKNVYWMYGVLVEKEFGMSKGKLREELSCRGIENRDFFIPLHRQPFLKKTGLFFKKESFPVADGISKKGFYLPSGSGLKYNEIKYISRQIKEIQNKK